MRFFNKKELAEIEVLEKVIGTLKASLVIHKEKISAGQDDVALLESTLDIQTTSIKFLEKRVNEENAINDSLSIRIGKAKIVTKELIEKNIDKDKSIKGLEIFNDETVEDVLKLLNIIADLEEQLCDSEK
jgi:hypothetical protein